MGGFTIPGSEFGISEHEGKKYIIMPLELWNDFMDYLSEYGFTIQHHDIFTEIKNGE